jgi:hypothetical protein
LQTHEELKVLLYFSKADVSCAGSWAAGMSPEAPESPPEVSSMMNMEAAASEVETATEVEVATETEVSEVKGWINSMNS